MDAIVEDTAPRDRLMAAAAKVSAEVMKDRGAAERLGRTPPNVLDVIYETGLFRTWLPRALGGFEADPLTYMDVVEEVSAADGAVGWNVMNGAGLALTAAYMPHEVAAAIWDGPKTVVAGQAPPKGRATRVEGGYRITGRWSFGSGILHATHVLSGAIIFDGDQPAQMPKGLPPMIHLMTPIAEVSVDTGSWHVSGLRGTGSCDYALSDVFVPDARTFLFFGSQRFQPGPLYRLPPTLYAYPVAAVMLGIARAAVEALVELAGRPSTAPTPMAERASVQAALAKADALVGAARAHLHATLRDLYDAVQAGPIPDLVRARARASAVHAPRLCVEAVDLVWQAAGASAIRETLVIERCFRDIHAARQHLGIAEDTAIDSGRVMLGLKPREFTF
ncbi:MAG: acyl-CoA dehydrogenase family protein [Phenylobacterium sp.]